MSRNPDLRHLDLERDIGAPETKRRYVRTLFDTIESSYDTFTHRFSFGMDARWKRVLVNHMLGALPPELLVLDLATGTGDLAGAIRAQRPTATVIGADLSLGMLQRARSHPIANTQCDMLLLPYPTSTFDCVIAGYGFRNAPDTRQALEESLRVLKPGGYLGTLDFYLPPRKAWRAAFLWYLGIAGRIAGRLAHGIPEAYGYIAPSLRRWMTAEEFNRALIEVGFEVERVRQMLQGGIAVHLAKKPRRP
jgi:demethylmenaquinone methyltransferase / 2-methoxy-6-polyprenyl-1,4-benzoquinol methylase